jgi:hypothetical protein
MCVLWLRNKREADVESANQSMEIGKWILSECLPDFDAERGLGELQRRILSGAAIPDAFKSLPD